MFSNCFSQTDIERVFKIECFQKDRNTFQKTHYSLSFTFKDPKSREIQMMEDALLESQWKMGLKERLMIGEFIRPYVVWGAPGTGKTELCRFLELFIPNYNPEYETKRVSKRELAMGGILGVAQSLSGSEIDLADRLISRHGKSGFEDVAIFAIGSLEKRGIVTIKTQNKDVIYDALKYQIRKNVEERVKQIQTIQDVSKIESTLEFVTKKDLEELNKIYDVEMDVVRVNKELYRTLTPLLYNVDDVKKLIFKFIKQKNEEGKIPVLIFDDVTHLGDLVNDFISVITDISGGEENYVCDFVIGTTTDFYFSKFKDSLASTSYARIYEIKFSPEERRDMSHANWLLGDDGIAHFLDFVVRYLEATRNCADCSLCKKEPFVEKTHNYYPFTKTFLINLYNRLLREKDEPSRKGIAITITPRLIIQVLRNVLIKFAESGKPPSSFIDDSLILNTLDFFKINQDEKEKFKDFLLALWWYGDHSKDGMFVSLDLKTFEELGLIDQIPSEFKNRERINLEVISPVILPPDINVEPKSLDDVSLKTNIRSWCKDEGSQIAVEPIVNGFNEIVKVLEKTLTGSNNFRNVMNYNSSREGETIEFLPPGRKECFFWVGEIKNDELQIYIMSKYKADSLRPYKDKGFQILLLNEDDFFRLYKIGMEKTSNLEKTNYLKEFLDSNRDDVIEALWQHRLRIKKKIEMELGCPIECYVLSTYLLVNKIIKSEAFLSEIIKPEDFKHLFSAQKDLKPSDWPLEIKIHVQQLYDWFEIIEDLFYSFFCLRGKGSIIDYPMLQENWLKIKDNPYEIIRNAGQVNDRVILSKSKKKFKDMIDLMKTILNKIEKYSGKYNDEIIYKEIEDLKQIIKELNDKKLLVDLLNKLKIKLETTKDYLGISDLNRIINDLNNLENPSEIVNKIEKVQKKIKNTKDFVDKASLLALVNWIKNLNVVHTGKKLDEVLNYLEEKQKSVVESELSRLKEEIINYHKIIKVFKDV